MEEGTNKEPTVFQWRGGNNVNSSLIERSNQDYCSDQN
jgi:hypothetical protein